MKKFGIALLIIVILLCGFGSFALRAMRGGAAKPAADAPITATRGNLAIEVDATGTVEPLDSVEVKSRVEGRLQQLFVHEGDAVKKGQLIAVIDPKQTRLQVEQDQAQLMGAESAVDKATIDMNERRLTAESDLASANAKLMQLEAQNKVQPILTETAIQNAEASLASAEKEKDRMLTSTQPAARIQSHSAIDQAKANLANAESQNAREQTLLKRGYVSKKDAEDAALALQLAQVTYTSALQNDAKQEAGFKLDIEKQDDAIRQAKAALATALANKVQNKVAQQQYLAALADKAHAVASLRDVASLEASRQQALATVQQFQSVLGDAQRQLGETDIRSPLNGIVAQKEIQVGELVAALGSFSSGTAILRIEDRTHMRVTLDVNEIDTARLRVGMPATIKVDALPNHSFTGEVTKIAPSSTDANNASTSSASSSSSSASSGNVVKFQVEIRINDPTAALRTGMSAECQLNVLNKQNVVLVPPEYVGKDSQGNFVMVIPGLDKNKKPTGPAKRVSVTVGDTNGSEDEIASGLNGGEMLVKPAFTGPARQGVMSGQGGGG